MRNLSISEEFKNRLGSLIEELDCKRTELPLILGVDGTILSKALNYGIVPRPRTISKLADYFSVSIPYLLGQTQNDDFEPSTKNQTFFQRLEQLRNEANLSYYKLAQLTHLETSHFALWKKTNYIPEFVTLELLSDFFKVSIDYLLARTDQK